MTLWTPDLKSDGFLPRDTLSIDEVLYEFDGPLIFNGKFGPLNCLFLRVKDIGSKQIYLAAEMKEGVVRSLKEGNLSVFGAMGADDYWLVALEHSVPHIEYWRVSRPDIPERFFPASGSGLYHWHGLVPDSLSQAEGLLSIKYEGASLADDGMPFGKLKSLVDQSYSTMRRLLAPISLLNSRYTTFDIEVAPLEFSSLIISAKAPVINAGALKRSDAGIDASQARKEFYDRADQVATKLSDFKSLRDSHSFSAQYAADNFSFLSLLLDVLPKDDGFLSRTEINARSHGKVSVLTFTRAEAAEIRDAVKVATSRQITEIGTVGGYIEKSHTLRFRSPRGKEVTSKFKVREFEQLTSNPKFRNGAQIRLTGRLTVRQKIDFLDVHSYDLI